jgi:hypothetical protein
MANMRAVVGAASRSYRFVGISVSPITAEYASRTGLGNSLFLETASAPLEKFGIRGTPFTLVVSPEGKVLESWPGAYTGDTATKVERFFKVRLPGLS